MPEVIINGPEGRLECRYMPAEAPDAPTALILHPEPDKGGTMNNRVTYALYKHFQARGFAVMRFNFRGVGTAKANMTTARVNYPMQRLPWIGCRRKTRHRVNAGLPDFPLALGLACS